MPRSTKVKGIRVEKSVAKMLEAAAESAGESFNAWAKKHLRREALQELGLQPADDGDSEWEPASRVKGDRPLAERA